MKTKAKIARDYPRTWDEVRELPNARSLYRRGIRRALEMGDVNFLITELRNPRLRRDMSRGLMVEHMPVRLLIAALPAAHADARRLAAQVLAEIGELPIPGSMSLRVFLKRWLRFLEQEPPPELMDFLRNSYFLEGRELRRLARKVLRAYGESPGSWWTAVRALEKTGLLKTLNRTTEHRENRGELFPSSDPRASTKRALREKALLDKEELFDRRASSPWFLLIFFIMLPAALTVAAGAAWGWPSLFAGGLMAAFNFLAWTSLEARFAYRRMRPRFFRLTTAEDMNPLRIAELLNRGQSRYANLNQHANAIDRDAILQYGWELNRLAAKNVPDHKAVKKSR